MGTASCCICSQTQLMSCNNIGCKRPALDSSCLLGRMLPCGSAVAHTRALWLHLLAAAAGAPAAPSAPRGVEGFAQGRDSFLLKPLAVWLPCIIIHQTSNVRMLSFICVLQTLLLGVQLFSRSSGIEQTVCPWVSAHWRQSRALSDECLPSVLSARLLGAPANC